MTKGGATALGISQSIGSLRTGFQADILVADGDPSADLSSLRKVHAVYRAAQLVSGLPPSRDGIASRQRSDCKAVGQPMSTGAPPVSDKGGSPKCQ